MKFSVKLLACALAAFSLAFVSPAKGKAKSHSRSKKAKGHPTVFVYGAETGTPGDKKCHDFRGECILFVEDEDPVAVKTYDYQVIDQGDAASISLDLGDKKSDATIKALAALSKRFLGKRLAVVVSGMVINAPEVSSVLDQAAFQLNFGDRKSFDIVKKALSGG